MITRNYFIGNGKKKKTHFSAPSTRIATIYIVRVCHNKN